MSIYIYPQINGAEALISEQYSQTAHQLVHRTKNVHTLVLSTGFKVTNGVSQGGLFSPYLFSVGELSEKFNNVATGVGELVGLVYWGLTPQQQLRVISRQ